MKREREKGLLVELTKRYQWTMNDQMDNCDCGCDMTGVIRTTK